MVDPYPPAHILHIDDNHSDYDLVSMALSELKSPIRSHHTENAVLGFSFLGRQAPFQDAPHIDLILLDVNLPVIDGLKALDILVSTADWSTIPVLMLSSSLQKDERDRALSLGAKEFLTKPSDWDGYIRLAAHIARYIESHRSFLRST